MQLESASLEPARVVIASDHPLAFAGLALAVAGATDPTVAAEHALLHAMSTALHEGARTPYRARRVGVAPQPENMPCAARLT